MRQKGNKSGIHKCVCLTWEQDRNRKIPQIFHEQWLNSRRRNSKKKKIRRKKKPAKKRTQTTIKFKRFIWIIELSIYAFYLFAVCQQQMTSNQCQFRWNWFGRDQCEWEDYNVFKVCIGGMCLLGIHYHGQLANEMHVMGNDKFLVHRRLTWERRGNEEGGGDANIRVVCGNIINEIPFRWICCVWDWNLSLLNSKQQNISACVRPIVTVISFLFVYLLCSGYSLCCTSCRLCLYSISLLCAMISYQTKNSKHSHCIHIVHSIRL